MPQGLQCSFWPRTAERPCRERRGRRRLGAAQRLVRRAGRDLGALEWFRGAGGGGGGRGFG